ncbi:MAG: hypothetical protein ABW086_03675 [Sedimenticola sp.]
MPIVKGDTDMWYHLNGGRYFWETGSVPITPFFSFIDPDREWINYFWGFQAVIYKIHQWFGYQGLVIARALLVVSMLFFVVRFLVEDIKHYRNLLLFIILTSAFVVFLESRGFQLRPHLVSYLMISVFLFILELRPKWIPILPLLTVIWVNIHGVEWVVGGLICGAYFIEHIASKDNRSHFMKNRPKSFPYWLLLCGAATLINPHNIAILASSFKTPELTTEFINELMPLNTAILHTLTLNDFILLPTEGLTIISFIALFAALKLALIRSLRVSHLILLIGGAYLLTRGTRLAWEWSLLILPMISAWSRTFKWKIDIPGRGHLALSVLLAISIVPFTSFGSKIDLSRTYPFEDSGLPTGITQFLSDYGAKGNIIIPPSDAGHIQWILYPDILIHSDMEYPPFNEIDFIEVSTAFNSKESLSRTLQTYRIDFIAAPNYHTPFAEIIKAIPEYAPVFIGDEYILYANRQFQSKMVDEYTIETINPYNLTDNSIDNNKAIETLLSIADRHPDIFRTHHALARLLLIEERYEEALSVTSTMLKRFPDNPNSHFFHGNALENTERCSEAIKHYEHAKKDADETSSRYINKHIGSCHYVLQDFPAAYRHLNEAMRPFNSNEPIENLYQLAFTGLIMGETMQARAVIHSILKKAPHDKANIRRQAEDLLRKIDEGRFEVGLLDWLGQLSD